MLKIVYSDDTTWYAGHLLCFFDCITGLQQSTADGIVYFCIRSKPHKTPIIDSDVHVNNSNDQLLSQSLA